MEKLKSNINKELNKTGLGEQSKKNYLNRLIALVNCMKYKGTSLLFLKNKKEQVIKCLEDKSDNTKKLTYFAIVKVIENKKSYNKVKEEYLRLGRELADKILGNVKQNKVKEGKEERFKETFSQVSKRVLDNVKLEYEKKQTLKTLQEYLLMKLYFGNEYIPRLDYHNTMIVGKITDNGNQISKSGKVKLTDFKNVSANGVVEFKLNKETIKILKEFIALRKDMGIINKYLFITIRGNKFRGYNDNNFGNLLSNTVKKYNDGNKLTINDIRKLREIELINSERYKNMTFAEKEKEHRKLFHGKQVAEMFYNKKI